MSESEADRPVLRVLRGGEPTDEEVAALVAVITTAASAGLAAPQRNLREPLSPWVKSGLVKGTRTKA